MTWMIPLIASISALVALWLSRPERKRMAILASALALVAGAGEAGFLRGQEKVEAQIRANAHFRLRLASNRFKGAIKRVVSETDESWLPKGADGFFSADTAARLCSVDPAVETRGVFPRQRWDAYFSNAASEFRSRLDKILLGQAQFLDSDLVESVSALQEGEALAYFGVMPSAFRFAVSFPRFRRHTSSHESAVGVCHGEAKATEVHEGVQGRGGGADPPERQERGRGLA